MTVPPYQKHVFLSFTKIKENCIYVGNTASGNANMIFASNN